MAPRFRADVTKKDNGLRRVETESNSPSLPIALAGVTAIEPEGGSEAPLGPRSSAANLALWFRKP